MNTCQYDVNPIKIKIGGMGGLNIFLLKNTIEKGIKVTSARMEAYPRGVMFKLLYESGTELCIT